MVDSTWKNTQGNPGLPWVIAIFCNGGFHHFSQYYDSIGKKLSQKLIIYSILDRTVHFLVLFILFTVFLFSLGSLTILEKIIQKIKHTVGTYWMKWKKLHKNLRQFWFPSQTILVLSMTNWSIWRKKNFFWPPNDELWNMTKKKTFLVLSMTNLSTYMTKKKLFLISQWRIVEYDEKKPF